MLLSLYRLSCETFLPPVEGTTAPPRLASGSRALWLPSGLLALVWGSDLATAPQALSTTPRVVLCSYLTTIPYKDHSMN